MTQRSRHVARFVPAAMLAALLLVGSPISGAAGGPAAADDLLPDLAMARPLDIQLQTTNGRADRYGAELSYESIDVTGLPAGEYLLRVTVDPNGYFEERATANNCNRTRIQIGGSGAAVSILDWSAGCTLPGTTVTPAQEVP